jgi:hypothetical protein
VLVACNSHGVIGTNRDKRPLTLKAKVIHLRTIGNLKKKITKQNFLIEAQTHRKTEYKNRRNIQTKAETRKRFRWQKI